MEQVVAGKFNILYSVRLWYTSQFWNYTLWHALKEYKSKKREKTFSTWLLNGFGSREFWMRQVWILPYTKMFFGQILPKFPIVGCLFFKTGNFSNSHWTVNLLLSWSLIVQIKALISRIVNGSWHFIWLIASRKKTRLKASLV